jgi:hypothetical protein
MDAFSISFYGQKLIEEAVFQPLLTPAKPALRLKVEGPRPFDASREIVPPLQP